MFFYKEPSRLNLERVVAQLSEIVGRQWVSTSLADQVAYSRDQWPKSLIQLRAGNFPVYKSAVVWPGTPTEVAEIVKFCAGEGIALTPVGGGSAVTGASAPSEVGVVLDLKRLNKIRSLNARSKWAEVEAGIVGYHLEEELQQLGWTLGHFPSSIFCSTLGGWAATRSAGQASSRYGKIEDLVFDVEFVTPGGDVRWSSQLMDLTPLIIGSEGLFGIITACRIKIFPAPKAREYRGVLFPELSAGLQAMRELMQSALPPPTVMRLYDPLDTLISSHRNPKIQLFGPAEGPHTPLQSEEELYLEGEVSSRMPESWALVERGSNWLLSALREKLGLTISSRAELVSEFVDKFLPRQSLLILGYEEGDSLEARENMERALEICLSCGGRDLGEKPGWHWFYHRYSVSFKQSVVFGLGGFSDTMEVASRWRDLSRVYREVKEAIAREALVMAHFSHAYPDGCSIYFTFASLAPEREEQLKYRRIWESGLAAAARSGATISHHHGVGKSKAAAMSLELGDRGKKLIRSIQSALSMPEELFPDKLLRDD